MSAGAATVLVAADDEPIRRLLVLVLRDAGYVVEPVADGEELLHRLRAAARPHLVLLSLLRSRLNSRAVLEAMAAEAAPARGHGYVLLTALWDALPPDFMPLLRDLAVAVVPKPFAIDALLGAVAQVADGVAGT